jgi:DNA-binding NtrC family response regulator
LNEDGTPGPTLTLLLDPDSPYRGSVAEAHVLYNDVSHRPIGRQLQNEVEKRGGKGIDLQLHHIDVSPIDHQSLFQHLRKVVGQLRQYAPDVPLVVHVSPGTPAMHTVWVLMAETGLIEEPFTLVQSVRRGDRQGGPPVVPVEIGLETPLKTYRSARPETGRTSEDRVRADPMESRSARRRQLYERAQMFAQLKVPVLLLGERGTGKSTLATWIRSNSPFRQAVNDETPPQVACGQFSPQLVRSELFGHVKGAFTGAQSDREGLLNVADGDTLFLDEIADLSPEVQRLLIRAIENKEYTPEGSDETLTSDFRLITATNRPWDELQERLDADFLDRISYFTLEVPPLRETPEDLPALWRQVIRKAADRAQVDSEIVSEVKTLEEDIIEPLQNHPLPGNFRDLFSLAYHILAELQQDDATIEGAIERGLDTGLRSGPTETGVGPVEAAIAGFSDRKPLAPEVFDGTPLVTKEAFDQFRRYLATEIRRAASFYDQRPEELCDRTDRSLQDWIKL